MTNKYKLDIKYESSEFGGSSPKCLEIFKNSCLGNFKIILNETLKFSKFLFNLGYHVNWHWFGKFGFFSLYSWTFIRIYFLLKLFSPFFCCWLISIHLKLYWYWEFSVISCNKMWNEKRQQICPTMLRVLIFNYNSRTSSSITTKETETKKIINTLGEHWLKEHVNTSKYLIISKQKRW